MTNSDDLGSLIEIANYGAQKLNEIDPGYVTGKVAGAINSAKERFWLIARQVAALRTASRPQEPVAWRKLLEAIDHTIEVHGKIDHGTDLHLRIKEAVCDDWISSLTVENNTRHQLCGRRGGNCQCTSAEECILSFPVESAEGKQWV